MSCLKESEINEERKERVSNGNRPTLALAYIAVSPIKTSTRVVRIAPRHRSIQRITTIRMIAQTRFRIQSDQIRVGAQLRPVETRLAVLANGSRSTIVYTAIQRPTAFYRKA